VATLKFAGGPQLERVLREFGSQIAGPLGENAVRAGARVILAEANRCPHVVIQAQLAKSLAIGRAMVAQEEPQPEYSMFSV
jgi:hypothetical protein